MSSLTWLLNKLDFGTIKTELELCYVSGGQMEIAKAIMSRMYNQVICLSFGCLEQDAALEPFLQYLSTPYRSEDGVLRWLFPNLRILKIQDPLSEPRTMVSVRPILRMLQLRQGMRDEAKGQGELPVHELPYKLSEIWMDETRIPKYADEVEELGMLVDHVRWRPA